MTERAELIIAAFLGNILAEMARYAYRRWQLSCRPRWKCPNCGLLLITEDRESLDMVRNAHQAGHGAQA